MKLATFLIKHPDDIGAGCVTFARTVEPASFDTPVVQSHDHAEEILRTLAAGLDVGEG